MWTQVGQVDKCDSDWNEYSKKKKDGEQNSLFIFGSARGSGCQVRETVLIQLHRETGWDWAKPRMMAM